MNEDHYITLESGRCLFGQPERAEKSGKIEIIVDLEGFKEGNPEIWRVQRKKGSILGT